MKEDIQKLNLRDGSVYKGQCNGQIKECILFFFSYLQIIYFRFGGGYYSVHLTQQKKNHLST